MDKEGKKDGGKYAIATSQRVEEKRSLHGALMSMRNHRYSNSLQTLEPHIVLRTFENVSKRTHPRVLSQSVVVGPRTHTATMFAGIAADPRTEPPLKATCKARQA